MEKLKQQEENVKTITSNKKNYPIYNYNDYQKLLKNYDSNYKRLGGLGPNIGTEEWHQRKDKHNKISQYIQSLKKPEQSNIL